MHNLKSLGTMGIILSVLVACNPATPLPQVTRTRSEIIPTTSQATATIPPPTATAIQVKPDSDPFPLSERGPYQVGKQAYTLRDETREGREVKITVWYPARLPPGSGSLPKPGADPDLSGAPYPLILSSTKMATIMAPYLVSHGFTWASVDGIDTYWHMDRQMYEQPLDILFALRAVASNPPEGLEGMADAEHAGAIGYSFDGYNTLAMSGARIDPEHFLAQCEDPDATTEAAHLATSFNCGPAHEWDQFTDLVGEDITMSEDGLWQAMTDERIRAVMPLAGEGFWLFGEKGLASVDKPSLIIVAAEDTLYPENALIFEHLGTPDKAMIRFMGKDHMMIFEREMVARMAHFAVAFFGYHLQGREDYAFYFSEKFVEGHDDLGWGTVNDVITAQDIIPQENPTIWDLVVLGDSDMALSYKFYGPLFEEDLGISIRVHDKTRDPTLTPLTELRENDELRSLISEAEIVIFNVPLVFGGAGGACWDHSLSFEEAGCFRISVEDYLALTLEMIQEIKNLVGPDGAMIRLQNGFVPLRYWEGNPYLQDRLGKCVECYATYWEAQARLAEEEGIPIVDVLTLFHGPERDQDPYELGYFFDSDPHHVNFEGAKAISKLYQSIGYEYWLPTANDLENAE